MALLLIQKIASLYVILALGVLLTRMKVFQPSYSQVLSVISVYLLLPCMILSSFQVERTRETERDLMLAIVAALLVHMILLLVNRLIKRPLRLDPIEQTSVIYSNAGNLVMPLVLSILGREWVIYCSAFLCVQQLLLWSHAKSILSAERGIKLKGIVKNINLIAVLAGGVLFATGLRLPALVEDPIESMASAIGPISMLIMGMLIGGMNLRELIGYRRMWLIAALRLVALPLLVLAMLRFSGVARWSADGARVLLISFMSSISPTAAAMTSMALIYGGDAKYASAINLVTTLLCVVTMPVMISLYFAAFGL